MVAWAQKTFGDVQEVSAQRVIRVDNIVTGEGSLFNALRAKRPMATAGSNETRAAIDKDRGDAFCTPGKGTPEEPFGRVSGRLSVSASNIAKFDGHHGLVIFAEHDPLVFDAERIEDAGLADLERRNDCARGRWPRADQGANGVHVGERGCGVVGIVHHSDLRSVAIFWCEAIHSASYSRS